MKESFLSAAIGLKAIVFLVVLLSQDGFESDCPKSKFQTITSSSQLRSSRKQMFFSKCVLKNMCWSILLSWNRKLQQRYFPVNIVKFSRPASFIEHLRGLLLSVWWSNCLALDICRPILLNQKHNVGWFLLQRFTDLVRASFSHISRNHSNTFSSNKHAENEYWSKAKHCSKG